MAACKPVVGGIADNRIIARTADDVLDERRRIALIEECIGNVARRHMAISQICKLRARGGSPGARLQIDIEIGRVIGKVISVLPAAVPNREKDPICARGALAHTVDEHLATIRVPAVNGVTAIGGEIGAVFSLQGGDVQHHQALRITPELIRQIAVERRTNIGAVAHHGIFEEIVVHRHGAEGTIYLMGMLETHRMAKLVDKREPAVASLYGVVIVMRRVVEPGIAAHR